MFAYFELQAPVCIRVMTLTGLPEGRGYTCADLHNGTLTGFSGRKKFPLELFSLWFKGEMLVKLVFFSPLHPPDDKNSDYNLTGTVDFLSSCSKHLIFHSLL